MGRREHVPAPGPKYKEGDRFIIEVERVVPPSGGGEYMYKLSNGAAWMESRLDSLPSVGCVDSVHSDKDAVEFLCGDLSDQDSDAVREAVSELLSSLVSEDAAMRHALVWALEKLGD